VPGRATRHLLRVPIRYVDQLDPQARRACAEELRARCEEHIAHGGRATARLQAAADKLDEFLAGTGPWPDAELEGLEGVGVLGRRGGEDDERGFRAAHRDGIAALVTRLRAAGQAWNLTLSESGRFKEAILHNPDQIAGGVYQLPVFPAVPSPPVNGTQAEKDAYEAYLTRLKSYVGALPVNSSIGSQWKDKVQQAGIDVAAALPAPPRPIFTMNLNMTV
jgi:hypothetical protein